MATKIEIVKNSTAGVAEVKLCTEDYDAVIVKSIVHSLNNAGFEAIKQGRYLVIETPTNISNVNLLKSFIDDMDNIRSIEPTTMDYKTLTEDGDYYYHQNKLFSKVKDKYYLVKEDGSRSLLYLNLKNAYHIGKVYIERYDDMDSFIDSIYVDAKIAEDLVSTIAE